jgi:branched-chain amino acid transport system permease protein
VAGSLIDLLNAPREFWRRQSPSVRRLVPAVLITILLVSLAATDEIRWAGAGVLILIAVVLLLWKPVRDGFWPSVERTGAKDAHTRWNRQPPFVQRAVPPVLIAVLVILIAWAAGVAPDPSLIVLLAITYALYLTPPRVRRFALPLTVLLLVVVYPLLIQQASYQRFLFKLPIFDVFPGMDTMIAMIIFAMMAVGLNMVVGYAGLLDLGYVAFFALGAYATGWVASPLFYQVNVQVGAVGVGPGLRGIHLSIWLALLVAAVVAAVAGVIIGFPTLRLRGDYLAIVTLGFGEILPQIARNGDKNSLGFNLTNGPPGINPIDPPGFGSWADKYLGLPANFVQEQGQFVNFRSLIYWSAIGLLLITVFCSIRLRDSRLGRAWIAIREDEVAAAAMGVPLMRTKTWAYASGAFFGGIGGAWFAVNIASVFPDQFFFNISVFILSMVILGGMGNVWGVIAGALFLTYLDREGLSNISGWMNGHLLNCDPSQQNPSSVISGGCVNAPLVSFGIYGLIIVLVMLYRPYGLFPERRRKVEFETGVHDTPLMDVAQ